MRLADGTQPALAHVWLSEAGDMGAQWFVSVRNDGSFSLPAEKPGAYILSATGVNTLPAVCPVLLGENDTVLVDFTLMPRRYDPDQGVPTVVGPFCNYDLEKGVRMHEIRDGHWTAVIPCSDSSFVCQIRQSHNTLGSTPSAPVFHIAEDRAVTQRGAVRLNYDAQLPVHSGEVTVTFDIPPVSDYRGSSAAVFTDPALALLARLDKVVANAGGDDSPLSSSTARVRQPADAFDLKKVSHTPNDERERRVLAMHTLRCEALRDPVTAAAAAECRAVVPWSDPLWALYPSAAVEALSTIDNDAVLLRDVDSFLSAQNHSNACATALFLLMDRATARRQRERFLALHEKFVRSFGNHGLNTYLTSDYLRTVGAPGSVCPTFAARDLTDTTRILTNNSLRGKVTMLWIVPPGIWTPADRLSWLQDLYARHHEAGFNIVNLYCENGAHSVATNPPPLKAQQWQHALLPDWGSSPLATSLGIWAFPYIVLIDKEGKILVTSAGLRDDATLEPLITEALAR